MDKISEAKIKNSTIWELKEIIEDNSDDAFERASQYFPDATDRNAVKETYQENRKLAVDELNMRGYKIECGKVICYDSSLREDYVVSVRERSARDLKVIKWCIVGTLIATGVAAILSIASLSALSKLFV